MKISMKMLQLGYFLVAFFHVKIMNYRLWGIDNIAATPQSTHTIIPSNNITPYMSGNKKRNITYGFPPGIPAKFGGIPGTLI